MKKSPKQRFFLVIGTIFLLIYFGLGIILLFVKELPFNLNSFQRIAFGILLIVYAIIRFLRILKDN
jgi:uncharacterized membrane protein (DUF485 family)